MNILLYLFAALPIRVVWPPVRSMSSTALAFVWNRQINFLDEVNVTKPLPTMAERMDARAQAVRLVSLSMLAWNLITFLSSVLIGLIAGAEAMYWAGPVMMGVISLGIVISIKKSICERQFKSFKALGPEEQENYVPDPRSNPGDIDFVLALPFMLFLLWIWWLNR